MGKSSNFSTGQTNSYGIELCSDTSTSGGSYIDFTYPNGSSSFYAGRMLYANNTGYFAWNAKLTPAGSENIASPFQMILYNDGVLNVQTKLEVPAITLNGSDLAGLLSDKVNTTNPTFTQNLTIENTATTGTSNIYLNTNNSTKTARIYMDEAGLIKLDNDSVTALQVFPNGVLGTGKRVQKHF